MKTIEFYNLQSNLEADWLVIPVKEKENSALFDALDQSLDGGVNAGLARLTYQRTFGEICTLTTNGKYPIPRVLFVGIGGGTTLDVQCLAGKIAHYIDKDLCIAIDGEYTVSHSLIFGLCLRYSYMHSYKSVAAKHSEKRIHVSSSPQRNKEAFQPFQHLLESVLLARSLTAAPANKLNPVQFANKCLDLASLGLEIEVLDSEALQKEGLHALLSVGKGSSNLPYLVSLHWKGGAGDPIAFVGKGVCFDAGGINIKTEELAEMKWDKAGAATVVVLMRHLATTHAKVNAWGVIGLVENLVDGSSMKPGDIIDTHFGLTVEVVDTDNEGRLVLCDCLSYAQKIANPSIIIDLGTLTLETMGALAGDYAGLYSNDPDLSTLLIKAGEESGEKLWPLPMGKSFAKQIESQEADLKNCGTFGFGEGGAAAEFLRSFIKPGVKWAHLDIAGVAWSKEDLDCSPKGVTGFGVQLLNSFLGVGGFTPKREEKQDIKDPLRGQDKSGLNSNKFS